MNIEAQAPQPGGPIETDGEHTWGRLWRHLYDFLGGNPVAAMPSLHLASSVMAAHMLSEGGALEATIGWSYAIVLGFALLYLGEHYAIDLLGRHRTGRGGEVARATGDASAVGSVAAGPDAGDNRSRMMKAGRTDSPAVGSALPGSKRSGCGRRREDFDAQDVGMGGMGRKRIAIYLGVVVALVVGLYVALPAAVSGVSDTRDKVGDANGWWLAVALGFNVLSFVAYIALFRGVVGGRG